MLFKFIVSGVMLLFFPGFLEIEKKSPCSLEQVSKEQVAAEQQAAEVLAEHPMSRLALYL